jgi:type I restriction enzyme S subunit
MLPEGWREVTLKDIGIWGSGGTPKRTEPKYYDGGTIPWLIIRDMNDSYVTKAETHITEEGLKNSSAKLIPKNTLLIAMYGSIGKLGITKIECATNQAIAFCIIDKNIVSQKFVFYYLLSMRQTLLEEGKGGAQQNISQTILKAFPFPLPPLKEQKQIAQKLDQVLARVERIKTALDNAPATIKRFRQSVLALGTSGGLSEDWRQVNSNIKKIEITDISEAWICKYEKEDKKYKKIKLEQIDIKRELPSTWVETQLGYVFDIYVGSTPSRKNENYWNGNIPWVSSGEVAFTQIKDSREYITEEGLRNTSTNIHPTGTVLLAMIGQGKTRGQPAILEIEACHNQNTAGLRVHPKFTESKYLYYYLWERYEKTREIGGGNNQKALNKKTVQNLPFPLPPLQEQKAIVKKIETLFTIADNLEAKVTQAQERVDRLTQSILAKAFRGELK